MTSQARAALMRLREKFSAAWLELIEAKKQHDPGSEMRVIAQAQANDLQGVIFEIGRELAALPADEAAGASAGLVEAAERLLRWLKSDGRSDPLTFGEVKSKLTNALAAERALKPQPDERDKTIAELREKLRQATDPSGAELEVIAEMRQRAEKAESEAARYRETLVSKHGGEPLALLDELDEARAQLAEARKAGLRVSKTETPDDDATLREFVQWFESPGRHDIHPPVRAAYVLAKRALGVTGGGRKEVGDG